MSKKECTNDLVKMLRSNDDNNAAIAIIELSKIGEDAVADLVPLLSDKDEIVRMKTALALGAILVQRDGTYMNPESVEGDFCKMICEIKRGPCYCKQLTSCTVHTQYGQCNEQILLVGQDTKYLFFILFII